tara:strand:+ start:134 stop:574 length:441 start_codon:yes stop_codon:yes gene_type:complete
MLVNIQRVSSASVQVGEETISSIGLGLLVLICAMPGDSNDTCKRVTEKITKLRLFKDKFGKMNRSLTDVNGSILMVSQFTLAANTKSGNRPDFKKAMCPEGAKKIFDELVQEVKRKNIRIRTGVFGSHMKLKVVNDGPVTIPMDFQ